MDFKDTQAIYLQIYDFICDQILLKRLKEGERIPSVREMGVNLEVNPNTVMRTYDLLEDNGIIFNKRGVGFFVEGNAINKIISYQKKEFLEQQLPAIFRKMQLLNISMEELEKEYENYLKK